MEALHLGAEEHHPAQGEAGKHLKRERFASLEADVPLHCPTCGFPVDGPNPRQAVGMATYRLARS